MNNDLALEALQNAVSQELPFFLAIGYSHTHDPWTPGESARSKYDPGQFSVAGRSPVYKNERYDDPGIRQLVRDYYGEITKVDSMVGDLLLRIKELGMYERSIILEGTSFTPLLEDPGRDWKQAVLTHRAYDVRIIGVKTRDYTLIDFAGGCL